MDKREGVQNELHVVQKVSKTIHWRMEEENTKMCVFQYKNIRIALLIFNIQMGPSLCYPT